MARIETELIVQAIAQGFDEVAANMQDLTDQQSEGAKANENASNKWTEFSSKLDVATDAFNFARDAAAKAYAAIKEGAEIELAARNFDLLAKSIGTTSDVLMNDLRAATQGMMSDAELMAQAGEIMSLGLVDSQEEAVRLTNIISALGADMNQVVLTLTNQTTARFDQIGIAVDGFDEKVQALIDSGMSAEDAFSEAFLQQGEEQIAKVGSVADTTAGQLMKLEAEIKNVGDESKRTFMEIAKPAVNIVGDLTEKLSKAVQVEREIKDAYAAGNITREEMNGLINEMTWTSMSAAEASEILAQKVAEQEEAQLALLETKRATNELTKQEADAISTTTSDMERYLAVTQGTAAANAEYAAGVEEVIDIQGTWAEAIQKSQAIQDTFNETLANTASEFGSINTNISSTIQNLIEQAQFLAAGGGEIIAATEAIKQAVQTGQIDFDQAGEALQQAGIAALDLEQELGNIDADQLAAELEKLGLGPEEAKSQAQELVDTLYEATSQTWIVDIVTNVSGPGVPAGASASGPTVVDEGSISPQPPTGGQAPSNQINISVLQPMDVNEVASEVAVILE